MGHNSTGTARIPNVASEPPKVSRGERLAAAALGVFLFVIWTPQAFAQSTGADKVRISGNSDVAFGSVSSFVADYVRSQSVCLYAKAPPSDNYRITATGSGSNGAFSLSSGTDTLPYEVQWSNSPGQTSGIQFSPNVPLTGLPNSAREDDCSKGPASTASLIVTLRSAAVSSAIAGSYGGSLTLLVAPE